MAELRPQGVTNRRVLLGMAAALPLAGCATMWAETGAPASLKLVTFNIWHNQGDWNARRPLLVAEMKAQDADIIALQEVLEDSGVGLENQAQMLARELGGYHVAFVSTDPQGGARRYGNALLTRLPVLAEDSVKLDPLDDFRTALRLRVMDQGGAIDVVVTHLAWQDDAGPVRAQQINSLLDWLPQDETPLIVLGDFNAEQQDAGLAAMTGPRFFSALPRGSTVTTLNPDKGHPNRVIDHIFAETAFFTPGEARVFGNVSTQGEYPSDHFGVVATVYLK